MTFWAAQPPDWSPSDETKDQEPKTKDQGPPPKDNMVQLIEQRMGETYDAASGEGAD